MYALSEKKPSAEYHGVEPCSHNLLETWFPKPGLNFRNLRNEYQMPGYENKAITT